MDRKHFLRWDIKITEFSRKQTEILKGIGILLIVLHNILHNMTPLIGQNEFTFKPGIFSEFYLTIAENPLALLRAVFSYFGHYGVQIFVFFSAYGLTRKYNRKRLRIGAYLWGRVDKIYLSFLLCVLVYIILGLLKEGFITSDKVLYWDSLLWKVLLVSSFIPHQAMMPVGPWWFLPFIFQFYLLYPFLLGRFRRYGNGFLLIIALASILAKLFLNPYLIQKGLNINFMVFGHLPVLCLGIYLAAQEKVSLRGDILVAALVLFIIGNFNFYVWVLEDIAFTVLVLGFSIFFINNFRSQEFLTVPLLFFGGISFHLFMVNGFLRSPFHNFAESSDVWWIDNLAAFGSLAFSTLFAVALSALDAKLRRASQAG